MPFYTWSQLHRGVVGPHYSTAEGPTIKGRKIEIGRYRYAAGTGAKPHRHPEEQVINVLSGSCECGSDRKSGFSILAMPHTFPPIRSTRCGPWTGRLRS